MCVCVFITVLICGPIYRDRQYKYLKGPSCGIILSVTTNSFHESRFHTHARTHARAHTHTHTHTRVCGTMILACPAGHCRFTVQSFGDSRLTFYKQNLLSYFPTAHIFHFSQYHSVFLTCTTINNSIYSKKIRIVIERLTKPTVM